MSNKPSGAASYRIANLSVHSPYFRWEFINNSHLDVEIWIADKEYVHDADNCGENITFWVVVSDKARFYRSTHSWWWHNYGEEDSELVNEFEIAEVELGDLDRYAKDNVKFIC